MLFDTHVHLNDPYFADNLDEYIKKAHESDVQYMIVVGYNIETNAQAIEIANQYENVYAAIGFHPNNISDITAADYAFLRQQLQEEKVVALGEIGLDFHWNIASQELQTKAFIEQIAIANELNLPIIIHSRDAMEMTYEIIKKHPVKGVMHCFSGSLEMAKQFIDLGIYISLAGPVTFKNAHQPKRVAKELDLNYLLVETDCPYLTPEPFRGKKNEPAYVKYVAQEIAQLRAMPTEEVAKMTTQNAFRLFLIKNEK